MTEKNAIETFRKSSKLFALLDAAGTDRLLKAAEEVDFPEKVALMTEGQVGTNFFVLLEGTVDVLIGDAGEKKVVATLGEGAFIGEIAAILGEPRSATVVTHDAVRALRFNANHVQDVLQDYPKVREALVKLALKRSEDNLQTLIES